VKSLVIVLAQGEHEEKTDEDVTFVTTFLPNHKTIVFPYQFGNSWYCT